MEFKPYRTRQGWGLCCAGLVLLVAFLASLVFLFYYPIDQTTKLIIAIFLAALPLIAVFIVYWGLAILNLKYTVDRNGIRAVWGGWQLTLPARSIVAVGPLNPSGLSLEDFRGYHGGSVYIGSGRTTDGYPVHLLTTAGLDNSLAIVTESAVHVISPVEPQRFLNAWERRRSLGCTQKWSRSYEPRWRILGLPIWHDRMAWGVIAIGLLVNFALFLFVFRFLPDAPTFLPIHFDIYGRADRIAPKEDILRLPLIGLLVWSVNAALGFVIHRRERILSFFLWVGAILVQVLLWIAVDAILR